MLVLKVNLKITNNNVKDTRMYRRKHWLNYRNRKI